MNIQRDDPLQSTIRDRLRAFAVQAIRHDSHHAARHITPNPAEVASIHRIPVAEFLRADAPLLERVAHSEHQVLRMPVGDNWIAAPTAAILYQFREVCIAGRPTRVAHFEQPEFAWK